MTTTTHATRFQAAPEKVRDHSGIEGFGAELLPSANTAERTTTVDRADPYWDRLWAPGSQAYWTTADTLRAHVEAGAKIPTKLRATPDPDALLGHRDLRKGLDLLAAADSWRTISTQQAAALIGDARLANPDLPIIRHLLTNGLVDVGSFPDPYGVNAAPAGRDGQYRTKGFGRVLRPGRSDTFNRFTDHLTWAEWVSITGGHPWPGPGLYDRHNILAAELALRSAEMLPVATVYGEKYSSHDLLAGTGAGRAEIRGSRDSNRRADGTIVLSTGLKVALEVTASNSDRLISKVAAWARLIRDAPLDTTGLVVLFVAAPDPERTAHRNDPSSAVRKTIAEVVSQYPGTGRNDPARRIGFVHWREWFPARHQVSDRFMDTQVWFPTGRGLDRWQPASLEEIEFDPQYDMQQMVDAASVLASTPHWLRTGTASTILGDPMQRAGVEVPEPEETKPLLGGERDLGAPSGWAGQAKLPPRLR
ncbi:hypothetical protein LG293_17940 (plasmid) [Citricoccus nitrophenolicus]